jgi:transcriptional regulator with XRE-family HTH domain
MQRATPEELYWHIGKAIHMLRTSRKPKMSQQALAHAVGISRASIANIERGHHRVQIHVLYEIALALEVEPHDLLLHINQTEFENRLPADVTKGLNAKERIAVGRLLDRGQKGETNERR